VLISSIVLITIKKFAGRVRAITREIAWRALVVQNAKLIFVSEYVTTNRIG